MIKQFLRKQFIVVALVYIILMIFLDKFIFETTLIVDSWGRAYKNFKNEPQFYKMLSMDMPAKAFKQKKYLILIWDPPFGNMILNPNVCPGCIITYDQKAIQQASAVLFHCIETRDNSYWLPWKSRIKHQRWIWFCMEPPWNIRYTFQKTLTPLNNVFNWTMTYRLDSDVLASYSLFPLPVLNKTIIEIIKDKTAPSLGAWISSNCHAKHRINFMNELSQYIPIDLFGKCGNNDLCRGQCEKDTLYRYKFFFALENSFCKDYISEKFWVKAISYHVVPVVMGPPRRDYELVAPPNSFIHVDDFDSTKSLADYLIKLNQDDELYGKYLQWMVNDGKEISKKKPDNLMNNSLPNGLCGVCEKLKREPMSLGSAKSEIVEKLDEWWFGKGYSPRSDHFSICYRSSQSGKHRRLKVTFIFNGAIFLIGFMYWLISSRCRRKRRGP